jgi:hypothetical protein
MAFPWAEGGSGERPVDVIASWIFSYFNFLIDDDHHDSHHHRYMRIYTTWPKS